MRLYQSFATVGGMTMLSRVLGFVRDMMIALVLGTGPVADAFFVAFRFPNLFRRLFAEGAFNAAFVPLFAKRLEGEGIEAARKFAQEALSALTAVLLVLTAFAEITMPGLMYAIAPGFSSTPEKFDLAVQLTRIAFPYLLCVSLVALFSGVLNALGKFALAAFAPVLLNVVFIFVLAGLALSGTRGSPEAGHALAWAVFVAGFAQLGALLIGVRGAGMGMKLQRPRLTEGVRRLVRLGIPGVIAGGITQVNILIGTIIASLQDSAVSWLYYADRIYQLPLGVIGIAVGVVLLPDLSRKLRAGNHQAAIESKNRSLEFSMFFYASGGGGVVCRTGAHHSGSVRTRRVHRGRHAGHRAGPRGVRRRSARIRGDKGFFTRFLCARGHEDADDLCGDLGGRKMCSARSPCSSSSGMSVLPLRQLWRAG